MVRVIKTKSVVERTEKHLSDVVLLTELFTDVVKRRIEAPAVTYKISNVRVRIGGGSLNENLLGYTFLGDIFIY